MAYSKDIIDKTIVFVKKTLTDAEGGHDWFHIQRVYNNALLIAKDGGGDLLIISLAALLHDIADSKFYDGDETIGPQLAQDFLETLQVEKAVIEHVINIIHHISFKNTLETKSAFHSKELDIVQDADRLDAIGAIGIARCFNYGGYKNRSLYNPSIKPVVHLTKKTYKKNTAPTINHFYEKLLLLKDQMNTPTGKVMAEERHVFMEQYLDQFYKEWHGDW